MLVIEHKNQAVEIIHKKERKVFYPEFDLAKTKELLIKFNNIKTKDGKKLYEYWQYKGFYILPALQEKLGWFFFVYLVAHKEAIDYIYKNGYDLQSINIKKHNYYVVGGLKRIQNQLKIKKNFFKHIFYNIFMYILNKRLDFSSILFIPDSIKGFRYKFLKSELKKISNFSIACKFGRNFLYNHKRIFLYGYKLVFKKYSNLNIDSSNMAFFYKYINKKDLNTLFLKIDKDIQTIIVDSEILVDYIRKCNIEKILAYDEITDSIPMIIASKINKISFYTYQHGSFKESSYGWNGFGIEPEFHNIIPDKIIVWGKYWKDKLLTYSNKYNKKNIVIGSYKSSNINYKDFNLDINKKNNLDIINIFYPFEFLVDGASISKYLRFFLSLKWKIYVKMRPNSFDNDKLMFDEDIRDKLIYIDNISDAKIQKEIDLVIGSMSTMLYEMMRYNKPIWFLNTKFNLLKDLVEDNIAYNIDINNMKFLEDKEKLQKYLTPKYTLDDYKRVFSDKTMESTLKELLV